MSRPKEEEPIKWWPKVPCGTRSMVMEAIALDALAQRKTNPVPHPSENLASQTLTETDL